MVAMVTKKKLCSNASFCGPKLDQRDTFTIVLFFLKKSLKTHGFCQFHVPKAIRTHVVVPFSVMHVTPELNQHDPFPNSSELLKTHVLCKFEVPTAKSTKVTRLIDKQLNKDDDNTHTLRRNGQN